MVSRTDGVPVAMAVRSAPMRAVQCGHTAKENRPTQNKFHCVACGHTAHADTVGATNVLRAGPGCRNANPA